MRAFIFRGADRPSANAIIEDKFSTYMEKHEDVVTEMVQAIVDVQTTFDAAVAALTEEQNEAVDILLNSSAYLIWYEFGAKIEWANEAIQFLGRSVDWFVNQNIFDLGTGKFPVAGGVEPVNDAAPIQNARMFVQNSVLDQRKRTREEMLFYLYFLGTVKSSKVQRMFAVAMSQIVLDSVAEAKRIKEQGAEENSEEVRVAKTKTLPRYQQNLFSPDNHGCDCPMCRVKMIHTTEELLNFMSSDKGSTDSIQATGYSFISRFAMTMNMIRIANMDGVDSDFRIQAQANALRYLGAPIFLSRDEMRRLVDDDTLWPTVEKWGPTEREAEVEFNAYKEMGELLLATKRPMTGPLFNVTYQLAKMKCEFTSLIDHKIPYDREKSKGMREKVLKLLTENADELTAIGFPLAMFQQIFSNL